MITQNTLIFVRLACSDGNSCRLDPQWSDLRIGLETESMQVSLVWRLALQLSGSGENSLPCSLIRPSPRDTFSTAQVFSAKILQSLHIPMTIPSNDVD